MIIQLIVIKPNKVNNDINTNNNNNIIVIIKLIINENEVNDKKKNNKRGTKEIRHVKNKFY